MFFKKSLQNNKFSAYIKQLMTEYQAIQPADY